MQVHHNAVDARSTVTFPDAGHESDGCYIDGRSIDICVEGLRKYHPRGTVATLAIGLGPWL